MGGRSGRIVIFACAEGVRLPEREARTPKGPQGAERGKGRRGWFRRASRGLVARGCVLKAP